MAKIRGVKPDYWTDEDIVELSIPARLVFIGMWNYACDNGHLQDKPKQLKMRILPADDVNVAELLRELAKKERIQRADGWVTIPNFTKHQKPDKRYFQTCEKAGCVRPDSDSQPETRSAHHERTASTPRAHGVRTVGAHVEGDGDGDGEVMVKGSDGDKPAASKRATSLPQDFRPTDKHQELAAELGIDLRSEWPQFADFHRAKGSVFKDWDAALRNWIRNAKKFHKGPPPSKLRVLPNAQDIELPPDGLSPEEYAAWDANQRARQRT